MEENDDKYDPFGGMYDQTAGGPLGEQLPDNLKDYQRPPLRPIDEYLKPELPFISKRATVAFLSCLGFIIMFGMRTSMGIIKVKMVRKYDNVMESNTTWDRETLASMDAAIFYGYFVTQIPGGLIAAVYPANKLFGAAIGFSCFLNLFLPSFQHKPHAFIFVKVIQGLVEGVTYPACHGIMRHWAPPLERSRLATLAFTGSYAGVMFAMPITGELVERWGIVAPFYFYGTIGILWYLAWLWLVFEKPAYHTCIELKELALIETSLGGMQESYVAPSLTNTPWLTFFTSLPCHAIFVANFCRSWNFYLLVLFQASFFTDVYHVNLKENAFLGALPHLLMTIVVPVGGIVADKIRKKGILTTTQVRKLFNCGGFGMEATFFIVTAYAHAFTQGITALTIGVAFSGFAISGFNVNHLDIAPRYASILMGLSNGIGTLAGCAVPYFVEAVVDKRTKEEWRIVLIFSACVHYAGITFYGLFASGEQQPWADPKADVEKQWNELDEPLPLKGPQFGSNQLVPFARQHPVTGDAPPNYGAVYDAAPPTQEYDPAYQQAPAPPTVGTGNPFLTHQTSNPFRQEAVQPRQTDDYSYNY